MHSSKGKIQGRENKLLDNTYQWSAPLLQRNNIKFMFYFNFMLYISLRNGKHHQL